MILLDTHIWVWWISDINKLSEKCIKVIKDNEGDGLCVSIISCWEIEKIIGKEQT